VRVVGKALAGRRLGPLVAARVMAVGVDFSSSQLQGAHFDGADLRNADFRGADLRGASFAGANLAHARFAGANTGSLLLPNGRRLPARFKDACLDGADVTP
jgi:uncharacterized protein YjbI with pentapeptide repeats